MLKHLSPSPRPSRPLLVGMLLLGVATLGLPTLTGTTASGQDDPSVPATEPAAPAAAPPAKPSQRLSELEEQMRDLLNEISRLREQSKGRDSSFLRHHIAADCAVCHAQPPVHHGFRFHDLDLFAQPEHPLDMDVEQPPSADLTIELSETAEESDSLPFAISGLVLETGRLFEGLRRFPNPNGTDRWLVIRRVHVEALSDAGKDDRRAKYTVEGDVSRDRLSEGLKRLKQLSGAETLTIRAARDTATDDVLELVDTAKKAGFTKIRFAAPVNE
ncbi:MAG: ExbD/TolR family protein [Planctomycetaceae bacterium]